MGVGAEQGVGVAVLTADEQVELLAGDGQDSGSHQGLTREIASRGMDTHVGRLRAS